MLAAYVTKLDGATPLDNLAVDDRPEPEPRAGWAVVKVEAAALNHHDIWSLRGVSSQPVTPPQILGCDAAGVVHSYGPERPGGTPDIGARVVCHAVIGCGECPACLAGRELHCRRLALLSEGPYQGTLAEYVQVPAGNLVPLPDQVSVSAAACLPTAYLTAYRMLFTRAALQPGMTVLVQGASGGLGSAAVLLARAAGVRVIAVARTPEKREQAVRLGAELAVAPDRDAVKAVLAHTGEGVDAVVESVGEPTWELSMRTLKPDGVIVVAGATGGANPPLQLARVYWRQLRVAGSTMGTRDELARLVDLVGTGAVTPLIDAEAPLSEARTLLGRMLDGEQHGKLVLRP